MKTLRKFYFLAAIPSLFLLLGGTMFSGFVLHAIHINPVLNLFIIAVAIFGVGLIVYNIYTANWEYDKLMLFHSRAAAGETMEDLVQDPIFAGSEIAKVLVSVASTKGRLTSRIEQETIERSLSELHAHLEAQMEFPQYLTGFMIALGLLGTFIGLLETLVSTADLIDGFGKASQGADMDASFIHLVADLQKPLASMGTAFSASMFGLIGSLALGLTLICLRGAGKRLLVVTRECISDMVQHVVHEMSGPGSSQRQGISETFLTEFLHDLMVLQRESVLTSRNSSEASLQAGIKLETMNERLGSVAKLFMESIEESKSARQLMAFGPRMHEVGQQTLEEIRNLSQIVNQKLASGEDITNSFSLLNERLTVNGDIALRSSDLLPKIVSTMQSGQNALASALSTLQGQQIDQASIYEKSAQHIAQLPALLTQVSTRMADELNAIQYQGEIHASVATRLGQLGTAISENTSNVARDALTARQLQIDMAKHMAMQNERIKGLDSIPEALSSISEALMRQNVNAQTIIEEMRAGRQTLIKDLRLELREAMREISTRSGKN
ncbi:biopolymer transporter ExbB [Herbaspirillum sp. RTI4]|uniref:biopolymer transporter ExbB n=1 Tax=Herbaspirillum sp. RTI4 TaxID=3048640 RepID=UPI002AB389EB|nr:biopolymer transporter ExbB [Herbaspirillum sp. RTI4]MDY7578541.1 biopolymer transporter ExbB [Herbaspirillum sp. RTI4]MEA9983455.1 biopolymer transporter ExbB [Herbaspirillum sp. RTI4]